MNSRVSGKKNRMNSSPLPAKGVFNQKIEPQFIGSSLEIATVLFCSQQIQKYNLPRLEMNFMKNEDELYDMKSTDARKNVPGRSLRLSFLPPALKKTVHSTAMKYLIAHSVPTPLPLYLAANKILFTKINK